MHPSYLALGAGISQVYEIGTETATVLQFFQSLVLAQPLWSILLLMCCGWGVLSLVVLLVIDTAEYFFFTPLREEAQMDPEGGIKREVEKKRNKKRKKEEKEGIAGSGSPALLFLTLCSSVPPLCLCCDPLL